jgi:hypothetical protein
MRTHLILCCLLATATAVPAFAQSATGGVAGSASGAGNYGMSGNYGGVGGSAGAAGSGSASGIGLGGASIGSSGGSSSYGGAASSAGTGSYQFQTNGLPQGVSGLPSPDAGSGGGWAEGERKKLAPRVK